jgi:hypothetical protein
MGFSTESIKSEQHWVSLIGGKNRNYENVIGKFNIIITSKSVHLFFVFDHYPRRDFRWTICCTGLFTRSSLGIFECAIDVHWYSLFVHAEEIWVARFL